jgi:hypothetical protein
MRAETLLPSVEDALPELELNTEGASCSAHERC